MDDKADVIDVDTACCDVCGDQDRHGSGPEGLECPVASSLRFTSVEGSDGDASACEFLGETISSALGPDEHDRAALARSDS